MTPEDEVAAVLDLGDGVEAKSVRLLETNSLRRKVRNFSGLLKGLDHLDAVRTTFQLITDRFAGFQAE